MAHGTEHNVEASAAESEHLISRNSNEDERREVNRRGKAIYLLIGVCFLAGMYMFSSGSPQVSDNRPSVGGAQLIVERVSVVECEKSDGKATEAVVEETQAPNIPCSILFLYIGELPDFLGHILSQARCWNPVDECDLYLAGNQTLVDAFLTEYKQNPVANVALDVKPIYLEDLTISEEYWTFYRERSRHFKGFWLVTGTRVWLVEHVMRQHSLTDVVYVETDNSIYFSVKEMLPKFRESFNGFAVTPSYVNQSTMSVSYIRNSQALLAQNRYSLTRPGWEGEGEMRHLAMFFKEQFGSTNLIDHMPVCPYGHENATRHLEEFDMMFDNGAWGIWLGGPHLKWQSTNMLLRDHYCFPMMTTDKCCGIEFKQDARGRYYPVVHYRVKDGDEYTRTGEIRLANAHWHAKKTSLMLNSCNVTAFESQPSWVTTPEQKFWNGWKS